MLSLKLTLFALMSTATVERGEVSELYERGVASYQTHDFDAAIAAFTEAYAMAGELEGSEDRDRIMARLQFNLGRAHVSAYDIDGEIEHLRIARRLVGDYRRAMRAKGEDPDADASVQDIEAQLAEREAAHAAAAAAEAEPRALEASEPSAKDEAEGPELPAVTAPASDDLDVPSSRKLRVAGLATLGLAAPALGAGIGGTVLARRARLDYANSETAEARAAADARGERANLMQAVGYASGGVLVSAGVAMVVVDAVRVRRGENPARYGVSTGPGELGVGVVGRF